MDMIIHLPLELIFIILGFSGRWSKMPEGIQTRAGGQPAVRQLVTDELVVELEKSPVEVDRDFRIITTGPLWGIYRRISPPQMNEWKQQKPEDV